MLIVFPFSLFLFPYHSKNKPKAKSKIDEKICVGYNGTPAGANESAGNIIPIELVVSAP